MKIYINNFNIDILDSLVKKLTQYYVDSEIYIQIYAIDGIYLINDKIITNQLPFDNNIEIHNKYYENFSLIVDKSSYKLETVNAIHPEHLSTKMKRSIYKLDKNSELKLVIEGVYLTENNIKNTDIYFEILDDIDINNALVKKELIVFLSLLNNIVI
jgi:hypothetical protein